MTRHQRTKHLEDYYLGDDAFRQYVDACREHLGAQWDKWPGRTHLCEACEGDASIALAVYCLAAEDSLAWMDSRPNVLDGLSPRQCLCSDAGRARLREALLRSP